MTRTTCDIVWNGRALCCEFEIELADPSVGIMGEWPDDITLHDETGKRLEDLEGTLTGEKWGDIDTLIVEGGGLEYHE